MPNTNSSEVEHTLQHPEIHQQWEQAYRTPQNEAFYDKAFDAITRTLRAPENSTFLDVGCGSCAHSMRLVQRGFGVVAVDFSEPVLQAAKMNLENSGMADRIKLEKQNLLALTYPDQSFDYILVWGVLMHIPEVETAISELDRVLKDNGVLVIAENNMSSFQSALRRILRLFRGSEKALMHHTPAGLEYWTETTEGRLLTRYADIGWLIQQFTQRGYTIQAHFASQFSELYLILRSPLMVRLIHGFNAAWFTYIRSPKLALGNILIIQKAVSN